MGSGDAVSVPGWLPHGSAGVWRPCPAAALTAGSHPLPASLAGRTGRVPVTAPSRRLLSPTSMWPLSLRQGFLGHKWWKFTHAAWGQEENSSKLHARSLELHCLDSILVLPLPSRMLYRELLKLSVPQFPHVQTREGEGEETVSCLRVFRKIKWVHTCRVFTAELMGRILELRHCCCHYSQHWRLSLGDQRAGNSARLQEWLDGRTGKPTLGNCALSLSLSLVAEFLVPTCLPCSPLSGFLSLCLSWVSHGLSDHT